MAAEDCDAAARTLSRVPVGEFSQNPISDEAFDALQNFVKAQNAFSASIDAFVKETGKSSPGLGIPAPGRAVSGGRSPELRGIHAGRDWRSGQDRDGGHTADVSRDAWRCTYFE